jgi:electron transport complex protein RnfC
MKLKTFRGGVHPGEHKEYSKDVPYEAYLPKGDLVFPVTQHIGKPAKPVVKKGDQVLAGQIIAEADGFVSANIVSSCSGTVKAIDSRRTISGTIEQSIIIENDGQFTLAEGVGREVDYKKLSGAEILDCVKRAGIIGLGGAGFPTHVKLAPKNADGIEYVIANGAECEPYITCDDQLMRNFADEIVTGMEIILKLFPNAKGVILIENNKPEATASMKRACSGHEKVEVAEVPTKYPQGGERSIISVVTGRHIKLGMLPADAGCIVDNVATVRAIYRAVCKSEPLMEKGFTVSGDGVNHPCNLMVRIGTSCEELIEAAGGFKEGAEVKKILSGGPMMGIAMATLDVPLQKANNAITVLLEDDVEKAQDQMTACLRCGRCNRACPLGLTPQMMAVAAEKKEYERYEKKLYGLECIACGSCTYVCPARRPLMQQFKHAKAEIMAAKRAQRG